MRKSVQPDESAPRVLVVDDDEINLVVTVEFVRELGYRVATAQNGREAADKVLQEGDFAAVLMDCQMPIMDGYQATRAIREGEAPDRRTPIIALTAHAFETERQKVADAGMDAYLCKPIRTAQLDSTLRMYISPADR